jgi:hypothetical protein
MTNVVYEVIGDPVCADHDPTRADEDRMLHGAACHGCLLVSENELRGAKSSSGPSAFGRYRWASRRRVLPVIPSASTLQLRIQSTWLNCRFEQRPPISA